MSIPYKCIMVLALLVVASIPGSAGLVSAVTIVEFASHDIAIKFDVPVQEATITDQGEIAVQAGWNLFYLNADAKISSLNVGEQPVDYHVANSSDTAQFPTEIKADLPDLETEGEPLLVFFESATDGVVSISDLSTEGAISSGRRTPTEGYRRHPASSACRPA